MIDLSKDLGPKQMRKNILTKIRTEICPYFYILNI